MIGERIKQVRKERKISQVDFAKELGITQAYVSKLEKGSENPSDMLLKFISFRFGVSYNWLKTGEECNECKVYTDIINDNFRDTCNRFSNVLIKCHESEQFEMNASFKQLIIIFENIVNTKNWNKMRNAKIFEDIDFLLIYISSYIYRLSSLDLESDEYNKNVDLITSDIIQMITDKFSNIANEIKNK